jgi:hypothetical protein
MVRDTGNVVERLIEALFYEPEGRGFDSRYCHIPSGHTVAVGSTQPLTEIITTDISWEIKAPGA